ncbi:hypothetical protein BLNAU_8920 [Blattamonas nauphoetae]|uniref:Uncharacterized protein n=1 Tax=Blattamonas nauphoetae TaxID=2049346 RepID=A0ABQ9XXD7_9EUKA|nr:hypothetical protein BLNAU_20370 [Blattamonas nauphoetae]KAK2956140.1 hypothetical protein BLNAU_8920 [Blattamonas nauphoetae]
MKYSARLSGYLEHCHAFESLMETRFNDSVAKPQCFFPHTETDEYLTLFCIAFSTLAALPVLLKSSPDLISYEQFAHILNAILVPLPWPLLLTTYQADALLIIVCFQELTWRRKKL